MSPFLERIARRRAAAELPPAPDSATAAYEHVAYSSDDHAEPLGADINGANGHEHAAANGVAALTVDVAEEETAEAQTGEPEPEAAPAPGLRERGRIRRRARYLRRLREVQLRDIGGLAVELQRFGRSRPDLVEQKILTAAETDRELRALELALAEQTPLRELREAGIGGACPRCGAVHGSADGFCAACGEPLRARWTSEPGAEPSA